MTSNKNWRSVAELIGMVALIVSLLFVGLQMRQTNDIAYMDLDMAIVGIMAETSDVVASNADVWVKGNAGDELTAAEFAVYNEMIAVINTRWVVAESHASQLGRPDVADLIRRDWAAFLHQNPGARKTWLAREDNLIEYRQLLAPDNPSFSGWREAIQADLALLDEAVGRE